MLKKIAISLTLLFINWASYADTVENGPFVVSQLRFGEGGIHLALSPAPTGCNGGAQYGMHFKLDASAEAYHDQMISGLLTAYVSGQKLSNIWFRNHGTCNNTRILHLYMFQFEPK